MRFISLSAFICGILLSLCLAGALPAQQSSDFSITTSEVHEIRSGGGLDLKLQVHLPLDRHIYVKHASSKSFSILTSFSVASRGWAVAATKKPAGPKKDDDFILQGRGPGVPAGEYTLTFYETMGRSVSNRVHRIVLVIKTQMCNSKTNTCYAPRTFKKSLMFKVSQGKMQISLRAQSKINWVTKYVEAFAAARRTKQNVFVIITAPTWCGYCIQMERNTFTDKNVQDTLNSKFVSLRILDTNPDKRKFRFSGYPTLMVASPAGSILTESIGRAPASMLSSLRRYEKDPGGEKPDPVRPSGTGAYEYSITITGKFTNTGGVNWVEKRSDGTTVRYAERKRDAQFIILREVKTGAFYALPLNGGAMFIFRNGKWFVHGKVKLSE